MQKSHDHIDKILPHGELIRGFANQSYILKGDLKRSLRERGIFLCNNEKEATVPCLTSLLLSPREFDELRESQNTREDNIKKSSSRIEWNSDKTIIESLPSFLNSEDFFPREDHVNYIVNKVPLISMIDNNPNKVKIEYSIERYDMNKSWYETKNVFQGNIVLEKENGTEILLIKSYTSPETESVGNKLQQFLIEDYKRNGYINEDKKLDKILFGDFSNEDRIVFFWRLTSNMDNNYLKFNDIIDIEFRPDASITLPEKINWMAKKSELILKGNEIQNTFFIKEKEYHKYLELWEMEACFKFEYLNQTGTCNIIFSFKDFLKKSNKSEFEINISNFNIVNNVSLTYTYKNNLKNKILDLFEKQKNEVYKNFRAYLTQKAELNL